MGGCERVFNGGGMGAGGVYIAKSAVANGDAGGDHVRQTGGSVGVEASRGRGTRQKREDEVMARCTRRPRALSRVGACQRARACRPS
jgi:hypothetical protein